MRLLTSSDVKTIFSGLTFSTDSVSRRLPNSRCEGVRTSSISSSKIWQRRREFKIPSTSAITVKSSSYVSLAFPRTFLRMRLQLCTNRSQYPPHQMLASKINYHLDSTLCMNDFNSGPVKHVALSLTYNFDNP